MKLSQIHTIHEQTTPALIHSSKQIWSGRRMQHRKNSRTNEINETRQKQSRNDQVDNPMRLDLDLHLDFPVLVTHRAVSSFQAKWSTASPVAGSQLNFPRLMSCFIVCNQSIRGQPFFYHAVVSSWLLLWQFCPGSIRNTCLVHRAATWLAVNMMSIIVSVRQSESVKGL